MMSLSRIIVASILAFAVLLHNGCGKQEAVPQSEWETMIAIRAEAAAHRRAKTLHDFKLAIGEKPEDTTELRELAQHLFTRKNIDLLQRIENNLETTREETQVRRLRHYLIDGLIDLTLEPERRYIAEIASRPIELPDGSEITLHEIPHTLATEPNRDRREMIYNSQLPMIERINAVKTVELQKLDSLLMSLKYGSVTSYYQEVRNYDFAKLAVTAERILEETDSVIAAAIERWAPEFVGVEASALRAYDMPTLLHSSDLSRFLSREAIESTIDSFQTICEVVDDTSSALTVYWAVNADAATRSSTYPISAFDDVRIVVEPDNGVKGVSNYWHEISHALHYIHTQQREFEYIYLGAAAERELLAFVLEDVLDFWGRFMLYSVGVTRDLGSDLFRQLRDHYHALRTLSKLVAVRSHCSDFLFEYRYFAGLENPEEEFRAMREAVYDYPVSDVEGALYLSRLSLFESADYLVARIAAANVRRYVDGFEPNRPRMKLPYYHGKSFEELLLSAWKRGSNISMDFFSESLECDILNPDALLTVLIKWWPLEIASPEPLPPDSEDSRPEELPSQN